MSSITLLYEEATIHESEALADPILTAPNGTAPYLHQPECVSTRFMRKKPVKTGRKRVPADNLCSSPLDKSASASGSELEHSGRMLPQFGRETI
jgi:hypothetical protein